MPGAAGLAGGSAARPGVPGRGAIDAAEPGVRALTERGAGRAGVSGTPLQSSSADWYAFRSANSNSASCVVPVRPPLRGISRARNPRAPANDLLGSPPASPAAPSRGTLDRGGFGSRPFDAGVGLPSEGPIGTSRSLLTGGLMARRRRWGRHPRIGTPRNVQVSAPGSAIPEPRVVRGCTAIWHRPRHGAVSAAPAK